MGKLLKFLFGLVLVLVLLVAAAAVIVPLVVDPNDFKGEIVDRVRQATGRDLTIEGDIGLSVFPWLGVELGGLTLSQPEGFGDQPFAAVGHARVRAKLMPLLEQRLEVDRVQLNGLRLNLVRNREGVGNWEDLARRGPAGAAAAQPEGKGPGEAGVLESLVIGGINVADSRVSWDDRREGRQVVIQDLSLETGTLVPGQPLEVRLAFAVDNQAPKLSGRIQLAGTVTLGDDRRQLIVQPFELRLLEMKTADGLVADGVLKAGVLLDLAGLKLQLKDLSIEQRLSGGPLGDLQLTGGLGARVTADLAAQQYRLDDLKLVSRAKGARIPGGSLETVLSATVDADLARGVIEVRGLDLEAADLHVTGRIEGSRIQSDPSFTGQLALAPLDVRALLPKLGMEVPQTADPEVLKRFTLTTDLSATAQQATLHDLKISLDDSRLSGKVGILWRRTPGYRFALELDAIDLDRYLPPPAEPPARESAEKTAAVTAEPPLFPVERLRQLDIDGSFDIGRLTVNRLKLNHARITIKAKDGDIRLEQKVGDFYQGNLGGILGLNVTGKTPRLKVVQRAKGIQAQPLVQDLVGQDRLSGTGNFNLDVSGAGRTVKSIKRSLNGKLDFAFTEGTIKGFNLGRMLRETAAKLKGKSLPPDGEANETDFSELKGSGVIRRGVLHNDDLSAKSPLFRVTGKGRIDIGEDTLDYKIKPVLVASLRGQGGEELEELKGIPIPVHLTGPLAKPNWRIDLAAAVTESQKAKAKEKIQEKIREELPDDIKEKIPGLERHLDGMLKGLFN